jgi:hypothetical protein
LKQRLGGHVGGGKVWTRLRAGRIEGEAKVDQLAD